MAFGHPGAGGSHAFADPENNLAFAYVRKQMEQQILPNEKSLRLVHALYRQGPEARLSSRPRCLQKRLAQKQNRRTRTACAG
jgi:CubicO group peptidase (beta-lactamase class C family)